jgi:hypothetical protein
LIVWVGFAASDPVVTPSSLAGFAGGRRPMRPAAAPRPRPLSDRLRRSRDAPRSLARCEQWLSESPQGNHLLFFCYAQDVAHIDEGYMPHAEINVPGRSRHIRAPPRKPREGLALKSDNASVPSQLDRVGLGLSWFDHSCFAASELSGVTRIATSLSARA